MFANIADAITFPLEPLIWDYASVQTASILRPLACTPSNNTTTGYKESTEDNLVVPGYYLNFVTQTTAYEPHTKNGSILGVLTHYRLWRVRL
jgi:hypothetical protein